MWNVAIEKFKIKAGLPQSSPLPRVPKEIKPVCEFVSDLLAALYSLCEALHPPCVVWGVGYQSAWDWFTGIALELRMRLDADVKDLLDGKVASKADAIDCQRRMIAALFAQGEESNPFDRSIEPHTWLLAQVAISALDHGFNRIHPLWYGSHSQAGLKQVLTRYAALLELPESRMLNTRNGKLIAPKRPPKNNKRTKHRQNP